MTPPPNPNAAAARAAMMQHNAELSQPARKNLYPLDVRLPLWHHTCNDDGVTLWIDDPAELFASHDAPGRQDEQH